MPRGGYRENAGRKTAWKNSETQVIRVPKILVPKLMQIARGLDSGEISDFVTESKEELVANDSEASPGQLNLLERSQIRTNDSETKSATLNIPAPLSARALSLRLGVDKSGGTVKSWRDKPEFSDWTRNKDPEDYGWIYNEQEKLYHPIIDSVTNSM